MSAEQIPMPDISATDALADAARGALVLLDLRKSAAVIQSARMIAGAERRDPYLLGHDDPLTREDRPIAVFCVHGHEVSQYGAALLRFHGRDARHVRGGFEALATAGAPTTPLAGEDDR